VHYRIIRIGTSGGDELRRMAWTTETVGIASSDDENIRSVWT